MKRWYAVMIAVLFGILATPVPGSAQEGVITGRVGDSSDAVLPGVTITLTSTAVMGGRTQISDERGTYRFTLLPPGAYTLKFELPSFKTLVREGIQISAGFTATLNVALEVASVADTVTVVGDTPTVDVEKATVSTTFNSEIISVLPISDNIYEVFSITPGLQLASPDVGGSRAQQQQGVRNGGISGQFTVIVDGINVTQETDAMSMYYDNNSMQEFQLVEVSKSAEAATAGMNINMIVKTGSNALHGSLHTDWINPHFQGDNLNDNLRSKGITFQEWDRYHDTYFDLGGPLIKDKFWWYTSGKWFNLGLRPLGFYKGADEWLTCDPHGNCTSQPAQGATVPAVAFARNRNETTKLNYQLTPNHALSFTGMLFDKWDPGRNTNGCAFRFCDENSVAILYKPIWAQKLQLTSVLNPRMTLESIVGVHRDGPRHEYSKSKALTRYDIDTQERRGAYDSGGVHETDNDYRITVGGVLAANTRALGGNHNIRTGYTWMREIGNAYFEPRSFDIRTEWRGGFKTPAFITTYDAPFVKDDRLRTQSVFINDTWNTTRKLTLNLGFRYDRRVPYRPEQSKLGIGPYQEKFTAPATVFPALNNPVARLSLVYDVFGNGRTAVKFSYGGYSFNTQVRLTEDVSPLELTAKRYTWDGYLPPGLETGFPAVYYVPDPTKLVSVTGGRDTGIDPNLKLGLTHEFMADIDQQIVRDMTLRFTVVRKRSGDVLQVANIALPYEAYNIPVTFTDPGRDNIRGNSDDQELTVYSLDRSYIGRSTLRRRNQPDRVDNFLQYSIGAVKRFSQNWQMVSGVDVLHFKAGADIQNPNQALNAGDTYWQWQLKAAGSYQLPRGFNLSSTLRSLKGQPRSRTINTPSLTQGVISVKAEPTGASFYPTYHLVDLQLQKTFRVSERWGEIKTELTLANIFNNNAILGASNQTGAGYDLVTSIVDPRVLRLSVGYKF